MWFSWFSISRSVTLTRYRLLRPAPAEVSGAAPACSKPTRHQCLGPKLSKHTPNARIWFSSPTKKRNPWSWHEKGAQCIAEDAACEIYRKPRFRSNNTWYVDLFCLRLVLCRPGSSGDRLCRTNYSSSVTLFSLFLQLADVLCLNGLGTFDLFRRIQHNTGESNERARLDGDNAHGHQSIRAKECLNDRRTHLFRVVQAF